MGCETKLPLQGSRSLESQGTESLGFLAPPTLSREHYLHFINHMHSFRELVITNHYYYQPRIIAHFLECFLIDSWVQGYLRGAALRVD